MREEVTARQDALKQQSDKLRAQLHELLKQGARVANSQTEGIQVQRQ